MTDYSRGPSGRAFRAFSWALLLKGAVGGSVALLTIFGIAVPYLGPLIGGSPAPTLISGGIVASIGALLGTLAVSRA